MAWYSRLQDWYSSDQNSVKGPHQAENAGNSHPEDHQFDGHLDRGLWMEGLAPDHLPSVDPSYDPQTGITWHSDSPISTYIWHGGSSGDDGNRCVRGDLPQPMIDTWHSDPQARDAFYQVDPDHRYDFDKIIPGAQACYDSQGNLVDSGPQQGTWDYASPSTPGQSGAHWNLDVVPDYHDDNYTHYEQSEHSGSTSGLHWDASYDWSTDMNGPDYADYDTGGGSSSGDSSDSGGHDVGGGID